MSHRYASTALRLAAATAALAFAGIAGAAGPSAGFDLDAIRKLPVAQRLPALLQQARAKAAAAGSVQTAAPVLTKFGILSGVDTRAAVPAVDIALGISDAGAPLQTYIISMHSPSGLIVQRVGSIVTGQKNFNAVVAVGAWTEADVPFTRYSEPGTWTVDSVFIFDAAFAGAGYDQTQLAEFGPTTFSVNNGGAGYDAVAPTLTSGLLGQAQISLSTPPAGTFPGTLPYLSALLNTQDSGNGAVSGTNTAILNYCLLDAFNNCADQIYLQGQATRPGQAGSHIMVGGQPRADQTTGRYVLQSVFLSDIAGNGVLFSSPQFGGSTDFSKLFPFTTLNVTP
jgi:hypothetical protein